MDNTFMQLAIILLIAFVVSYIIRAMKQPLIIGYIIAGVILSPFLVNLGASTEAIEIFSDFGIAFLLFIVGLHLNPKIIKEIGGSSLIIGFGQIILTFAATFFVAVSLLGVDYITASYYAIAVSFSSTIIIMKLLSDKRQLDSLFGKISIGVLIIQDLVAIGVLMFISSMAGDASSSSLEGFIAGGVLIAFLFLFGYFVLPRITQSIAKSQELLFLFSICWCFVLAAIFSYIGFSMEIGALIAGIILSSSPYATEISSKIRPLRDFFLIIFFIILGLKIKIDQFPEIIFGALILSGIALFLKPFILMTITRFFGYTKRTNFLVGSTLAQISEFSLIVVALGFKLGHLTEISVNTVILTLVFTILISSYFITYSEKFYNNFSWLFVLFELKKVKKEKISRRKYNAILFGYNRIGYSILNVLKKINKKYLVVDFNPDTIKTLKKFNVPCLYGDVYDMEFLETLPLKKLNLIISTIPELESNKLLIHRVRAVNKKATIILRAHTIENALALYEAGANYVLTPHFLGGEYVAKMVRHVESSDDDYLKEKKRHIKLLKEILKKGHDHPEVEKN